MNKHSMLIVNSILGNIHNDNLLENKVDDARQQGKLRHLLLSRIEMEKSRLRKKTEDGFDIGLVLIFYLHFFSVLDIQQRMCKGDTLD